MPTGTFTQYTARQPTVVVSRPPSVGPSASPTDWAPAWIPRAKRILAFGALVVTRATLLACSIAAPIAWTRRSATRAPSEGARPHAAEATVKTAKP